MKVIHILKSLKLAKVIYNIISYGYINTIYLLKSELLYYN